MKNRTKAYKKIILKFERDKAINRKPVKTGKRDDFSIISHNFFDIRNYIKIKGKIDEK